TALGLAPGFFHSWSAAALNSAELRTGGTEAGSFSCFDSAEVAERGFRVCSEAKDVGIGCSFTDA
ncbi:MAG TPA: hypothetical protein VJA21_17990, partial [Verrucomicrobiae bacterium]